MPAEHTSTKSLGYVAKGMETITSASSFGNGAWQPQQERREMRPDAQPDEVISDSDKRPIRRYLDEYRNAGRSAACSHKGNEQHAGKRLHRSGTLI